MNKKRNSLLIQIFWTFFKISPVSFGGGFAMMPLMKEEVVSRKEWINDEEIMDAFALAQSTPGSVGVNSAAFIGFRVAGILGALAATVGIVIPTFLIVIVLSLLFIAVRNNEIVTAAFEGIRPAVVALIVYAAITTARSSLTDKSSITVMVGAVGLLIFFQVHPILLLVSGLFLGIIIKEIKRFTKKRRSTKHVE